MKEKAYKRKSIPVPKNLNEVEDYLSEIGEIERKKIKMVTNANSKIKKIQQELLAEIRPLEERANERALGVYIFSESNREEITEGFKKKTVSLLGGDSSWRFNPPSVEIIDEKEAIKELKENHLKDLIRIKEEVNKEEVLKTREKIAKLKYLSVIVGDEIFVIKPAGLDLELVKGKRKFKEVVKKS